MSDLIKSKLGYEYDLKDALRHNPTIIMAGDETLAVALARIEALKTELSGAKKDLTDMESRALKAEAENARLRKAGDLLSYCAQTSGGSAGWDAGLVDAINGWADACAALEEKTDDE